MLNRHADNPSAFLALNQETRHFRLPNVDGLIAYRVSGRYFIQMCGVFAAPRDRAHLLAVFLAKARRENRKVAAVQILSADVPLYLEFGFVVNQIGASYARSLPGFTLQGKHFVKLRNKISRARRAGVQVEELESDTSTQVQQQRILDRIDERWIRSKGSFKAPLTFMVGERGGQAHEHRRVFIARLNEDVVAYQTYSPVPGSRPGWLHDLTRRVPDSPPGVSELILHRAMETFRKEGADYLHFGLTPFSGLSKDREFHGCSKAMQRVVYAIADRGARVYPSASQVAYKMKWNPDVIQPEYLAFQGTFSIGVAWQILRLTKAVGLG